MSEKANQLTLKEIINIRKSKIDKMLDKGINPYPHHFKKDKSIKELLENYKENESTFNTAGRIISLRKMGKACFLHIQELSDKIQVYVKKDLLPEDVFDDVVKNIDIGDIIGVRGELFFTKTKELSIKASNIIMLSKAIQPLPNIKEKDGQVFFAFEDKELRYRYRYLDLIVNPNIKDVFIKRAQIISQIRSFLDKADFLEVETPVLQPIYGGANARPFKTYHNTLDQELYLRIADELYLKRLIIGGFEKVYEISKNFRNEGMDRSHNPEFTMLEFYASYADVYDMMNFTEKMIRSVCNKLNIKDIDISADFQKIDFYKSIKMYSGVNIEGMSVEELYSFIKEKNIKISKDLNYGNLLDKVFSYYVEPKLIHPTFIYNYPIEISPLAKESREKKGIVERFELFINGMEIANSFTELNNPIEQRKRLVNQSKLRDLGDEEAQVIDEDFIKAMEHGMPPTGGVGLGIDRLTMLLTGSKSIKDVILFPAMRLIDD